MSKPPATSWIIRTYNEQKWLRQVLRALMTQTRQDFDIIVVDSGSTDNTLEIVDEFPVKLIEIPHEDFGYSYALNLGIKESQSKYIGILSGHSVPVSNTWYADGLVNFSDPRVAGVSGNYLALPDGAWDEKLGLWLFALTEGKRKKHFDRNMTNTNSLIRRDRWDEYCFDERLVNGSEDYDWACEMISRGWDMIKDPKFNVYHSHGGLGRPSLRQMRPIWKISNNLIDKRSRPGQSFSKLVK